MLNKLTIIGNLGRDPEMRYTPDGTPVTNFNVACSRKFKDGAGEKQEETIWVRVSTWNKLAEICNEYLKKGSLIYCEGRLSPDKNTNEPRIWVDQNGLARASYEMVANEVKFLGGGEREAQPQVQPQAKPQAQPPEEDIPF